ncbi:sigma-54 dependent transcriptional regulator [bacterium]|nr:sigma-54 dependent transcriptional regulator [bacterium]
MGLVGRTPAMRQVFDLIRRVAASSAPVLVTGESGTGKELVAQAIHSLSTRRGDALVPVHCGAIPEELLESELFGHVKGAFTGAVNARTGRFRLADGGTVFLDEIGEMSPRFQVKLLRVLEDGTFEQVGGTATQRVDVRVVAATHRDLHAMAEKGLFRADLLYRLDVVTIRIPALRERREDIPLIAAHFLAILARRGGPRIELSAEAAACLAAYDWPGNVRELRNVIERAVVLSDGTGALQVADLPGHVQEAARRTKAAPLAAVGPAAIGPRPSLPEVAEAIPAPGPWLFGPEGTDFYAELDLFERRMIGRALQLSGGSKREAARLLGVNRTTLLEKLKRKSWTAADLGAPEAASAPPAPEPVPGAEIIVEPDWSVPAGLAPAAEAPAPDRGYGMALGLA